MIRICDAVLIEKHGSLTVGRDVLDAYHKLEKIEHAAEILLWANLLGRPEPLSSSEITALHRIQSVYAPGTRLFKPE